MKNNCSKKPTESLKNGCEIDEIYTMKRSISNNLPEMMSKFKREQRIEKALFILMWLIILYFTLFSCSNDNEPNCDAELQEIDKLQEQGFINCNGSTTCIYKMTEDYERRKKEILNNCR